MIRPNEPPGLTAALAKSVDAKAADLSIFIGDETYRAALANRDLIGQANSAKVHLIRAHQALREIAAALAAPPAPYNCGNCGAAVANPETHDCARRTAAQVQP